MERLTRKSGGERKAGGGREFQNRLIKDSVHVDAPGYQRSKGTPKRFANLTQREGRSKKLRKNLIQEQGPHS